MGLRGPGGLGLFAGLDDVPRRIEAETVEPARQPPLRDRNHLGPNLRVLEVEVGHASPEQAVVVERQAVRPVPGRRRRPGLGPARIVLSPHVPVVEAVRRRLVRLDEPRMPGRTVIHHEVHDDLDAALVRLRDQPVEVRLGAVIFLDPVVPVITGGLGDRQHPDRVHPEIGIGLRVTVVQIIESGRQPVEVPDPVSVRIPEAADEHLVENRPAGPVIQLPRPVVHRACRSPRPAGQRRKNSQQGQHGPAAPGCLADDCRSEHEQHTPGILKGRYHAGEPRPVVDCRKQPVPGRTKSAATRPRRPVPGPPSSRTSIAPV